jgi:hypothetical protein
MQSIDGEVFLPNSLQARPLDLHRAGFLSTCVRHPPEAPIQAGPAYRQRREKMWIKPCGPD